MFACFGLKARHKRLSPAQSEVELCEPLNASTLDRSPSRRPPTPTPKRASFRRKKKRTSESENNSKCDNRIDRTSNDKQTFKNTKNNDKHIFPLLQYNLQDNIIHKQYETYGGDKYGLGKQADKNANYKQAVTQVDKNGRPLSIIPEDQSDIQTEQQAQNVHSNEPESHETGTQIQHVRCTLYNLADKRLSSEIVLIDKPQQQENNHKNDQSDPQVTSDTIKTETDDKSDKYVSPGPDQTDEQAYQGHNDKSDPYNLNADHHTDVDELTKSFMNLAISASSDNDSPSNSTLSESNKASDHDKVMDATELQSEPHILELHIRREAEHVLQLKLPNIGLHAPCISQTFPEQTNGNTNSVIAPLPTANSFNGLRRHPNVNAKANKSEISNNSHEQYMQLEDFQKVSPINVDMTHNNNQSNMSLLTQKSAQTLNNLSSAVDETYKTNQNSDVALDNYSSVANATYQTNQGSMVVRQTDWANELHDLQKYQTLQGLVTVKKTNWVVHGDASANQVIQTSYIDSNAHQPMPFIQLPYQNTSDLLDDNTNRGMILSEENKHSNNYCLEANIAVQETSENYACHPNIYETKVFEDTKINSNNCDKTEIIKNTNNKILSKDINEDNEIYHTESDNLNNLQKCVEADVLLVSDAKCVSQNLLKENDYIGNNKTSQIEEMINPIQNKINQNIGYIPILSETNLSKQFVGNNKDNSEQSQNHQILNQNQNQDQTLAKYELNQDSDNILNQGQDKKDVNDEEKINIKHIINEREINQQIITNKLPKIRPSHIPTLKNKEKDKSKSKKEIKAKEKSEKSLKFDKDEKKRNVIEEISSYEMTTHNLKAYSSHEDLKSKEKNKKQKKLSLKHTNQNIGVDIQIPSLEGKNNMNDDKNINLPNVSILSNDQDKSSKLAKKSDSIFQRSGSIRYSMKLKKTSEKSKDEKKKDKDDKSSKNELNIVNLQNSSCHNDQYLGKEKEIKEVTSISHKVLGKTEKENNYTEIEYKNKNKDSKLVKIDNQKTNKNEDQITNQDDKSSKLAKKSDSIFQRSGSKRYSMKLKKTSEKINDDKRKSKDDNYLIDEISKNNMPPKDQLNYVSTDQEKQNMQGNLQNSRQDIKVNHNEEDTDKDKELKELTTVIDKVQVNTEQENIDVDLEGKNIPKPRKLIKDSVQKTNENSDQNHKIVGSEIKVKDKNSRKNSKDRHNAQDTKIIEKQIKPKADFEELNTEKEHSKIKETNKTSSLNKKLSKLIKKGDQKKSQNLDNEEPSKQGTHIIQTTEKLHQNIIENINDHKYDLQKESIQSCNQTNKASNIKKPESVFQRSGSKRYSMKLQKTSDKNKEDKKKVNNDKSDIPDVEQTKMYEHTKSDQTVVDPKKQRKIVNNSKEDKTKRKDDKSNLCEEGKILNLEGTKIEQTVDDPKKLRKISNNSKEKTECKPEKLPKPEVENQSAYINGQVDVKNTAKNKMDKQSEVEKCEAVSSIKQTQNNDDQKNELTSTNTQQPVVNSCLDSTVDTTKVHSDKHNGYIESEGEYIEHVNTVQNDQITHFLKSDTVKLDSQINETPIQVDPHVQQIENERKK